MIKIIFTYKGTFTTFECDFKDKIKDIIQKFISKIYLYNEKEISFFYEGNKVNQELTFDQLAIKIDKERKTVNILVEYLDRKKERKDIEEKNILNKYINKINYKFKKNPNLKYKYDISNTNQKKGLNDIFEVFLSYKDNEEYIVSPNLKHNLDIFTIYQNKKLLSLEGHKNMITTIRYFINNKDNNEYLISADKNKIIIIWDVSNNYNIKYEINTSYIKTIFSCLLIFPFNNDNDEDDGYIISSTESISDNTSDSATKIYSLNNGTFIRSIHNSNQNKIWFLLSWYNKNNNKFYIIQFSYRKIIIDNLLEDELYSELVHFPEHNHYSGFLYNKDNNDYLCTSSQNGYVHIWDLYKKILVKSINTKNKCQLLHIIQWNDKYAIVADSFNKSFKVIDLINYKVISEIKGQHTDNLISVKKIYHPIYGELLISGGIDKTLKLWNI